MKIEVTIDDPAMSGGVRVTITPPLNILEKAARVDEAPTPAQTYAMAGLNAVKAFRKSPEDAPWLDQRRKPRAIGIYSTPVNKVRIIIEDTPSGGVTAISDPKFSTLMSMVAGRSSISQVHQYALVFLARMFQVSKSAKELR